MARKQPTSTSRAADAPPHEAADDASRQTGADAPAPLKRQCAVRPLRLRFSLIIVTKGRPELLRAALESVARALPPNGEVIVVDGDPDRSAATPIAEVRLAHPDICARYMASEPGITLQRNKGIDAARGQVVVFIDDDCAVEPDLFEALARVYRDPSVIGATGLILEPANRRLASSGRLRRLVLGGGEQGTMNCFGFRRPLIDLEHGRDMEFMYGPLMSARRACAADVRFDESLGAYALGEDDDFSYRLSRRGRLRYEPTAVVHHHEMGRRGMDHRQMNRMTVVNKRYLFHKNFAATPRARACFAALLAMLFVHRLLNREWSGVLGLVEGIRDRRRSGHGAGPHASARQASRRRIVVAVALPAVLAGLMLIKSSPQVGARHGSSNRDASYLARPGHSRGDTADKAAPNQSQKARQRLPTQHSTRLRDRDRDHDPGDDD
jgi:glycosyltransferase involved in cell wall biosynthesis